MAVDVGVHGTDEGDVVDNFSEIGKEFQRSIPHWPCFLNLYGVPMIFLVAWLMKL